MKEELERIRAGPDSVQLSPLDPLGAEAVHQSTRTPSKFRSASENEEIELQLWLELPLSPDDEDYVWTDHDIQILREEVLCDALRAAVDGRNGDAFRDEIWEWIYSGELLPFSFRACAMAVGADPEELRANFEQMAARLGKATVKAA